MAAYYRERIKAVGAGKTLIDAKDGDQFQLGMTDADGANAVSVSVVPKDKGSEITHAVRKLAP